MPKSIEMPIEDVQDTVEYIKALKLEIKDVQETLKGIERFLDHTEKIVSAHWDEWKETEDAVTHTGD